MKFLIREARPLDSVVISLSADVEVLGRIPDSTVGLFFGEELFHSMYALGICVSLSFTQVIYCVLFFGDPFTLLTTVRWRPFNYVCVSIWSSLKK